MSETPFDEAVGLYSSGQAAASQQLFEQIIAAEPAHAPALHFLCEIAEKSGDFVLAEIYIKRALDASPENFDYRLKRATTLLQLERHGEAIEEFKKVVAVWPDRAPVHNNLAAAYIARGRLTEAEYHLREAVRLRGDYHVPYCNLGKICSDQARHREAIECYRQSLAIKPDFSEAQSNLLMSLCYSGIEPPQQVFAEHRAAAAAQRPLVPAPDVPFVNSRDPDRSLRVGYVSPDFREHSVAYFIDPVLRHHDPAAVNVFCYSDVIREDAYTQQIKHRCANWRQVVALSHRALAELIRRDNIDILVDLAGHTAHHRLQTFALRCAPVQVTWIGYPNTTGISSMDYRLTDLQADPPDQDHFYTETLHRLDGGFLCYQPPSNLPVVAAPPCHANGYITFGSFNNAAKISDTTVALWSMVLKSVPGSRLFLKSRQFADEGTAARFAGRFTAQGIAAERIECRAFAANAFDHLSCYGLVDISLDTVPYNGTTTTIESLLMGVPVVTLAGATHASRVGVSLLTRIGLPSLIADTPDGYSRIAAYLASDATRLYNLRGGLRNALLTSPLCNAPQFTRSIEAAFRQIWGRWCARAE